MPCPRDELREIQAPGEVEATVQLDLGFPWTWGFLKGKIWDFPNLVGIYMIFEKIWGISGNISGIEIYDSWDHILYDILVVLCIDSSLKNGDVPCMFHCPAGFFGDGRRRRNICSQSAMSIRSMSKWNRFLGRSFFKRLTARDVKKKKTPKNYHGYGGHGQWPCIDDYRSINYGWYPVIIHFSGIFSIIKHPFWGTPICGNPYAYIYVSLPEVRKTRSSSSMFLGKWQQTTYVTSLNNMS